jgi:S-methylmethionine-dependent homocysteine/selenocysteine methylase
MTAMTLLDGGLGQEIQKRSSGDAHALWSVKVMMEAPDIVLAVHRDYLDAGAGVICINAYAATPSRLAHSGVAEWFDEAQALAVKFAAQARKESGRNEVQLSGCLPPLVASYRTEVSMDYESSLAMFRQIVAAQKDGVDIFFAETMGIIDEARAAIDAGKESGKPVYVSFTVSDDCSNTLRSGETLADAVAMAAERGVAGILVNCSFPEAVSSAMPLLAESGMRFGGYANGFTSVDALVPGGNVDTLEARKDLGPEAYAEFASSWIKLGASIIGGCCEVGPEHIHFLDQRLAEEGIDRIPL